LQVEHDLSWWQAQGRQDALRKLRANGVAAREEMLAKAQAELARGEDPQHVLERLAHQLTNKLLHGPSAALRQAALDGDADLLRAAERLYESDDDAQPAP
jgi:glutamyl-tRNA reductase